MSNAYKKPRRTRIQRRNLLTPSDEDLLIRFRETGERRLFDQLIQRYEHELYSYLHRYLGDAEMAQDAFQTTFLQLYLKCEQFEKGRRLRPWLYMIATNQAIDLQRRNKRHYMISLDGIRSRGSDDSKKLIDLLQSSDETPVSKLSTDENRRWIRQALDRLPEYLRSVIILVYFQGLKYREASEVLSIPVGTVKSRVHTAVMRLTEAWNRAQPKANSVDA